MRIALLSIFLVFCSYTGFTAAPYPQRTAMEAKPPKRSPLPKEKKGTMGFVAAVVLGPVGYLGVHLFSHDELVRYRAGRGLRIWAGIVAITGLLLLAGLTNSSVDLSSIDFGP